MWTSIVTKKECCLWEQPVSQLLDGISHVQSGFEIHPICYCHSHQRGISTKLGVNQVPTVSECHQHHIPRWALHFEFSRWRFVFHCPKWTAVLRSRSPVMNPQFITSPLPSPSDWSWCLSCNVCKGLFTRANKLPRFHRLCEHIVASFGDWVA